MSDKIYDVPVEWSKRAFVDEAKYSEMYARSISDPKGFWAEQAQRVDWIEPFTEVENTSFAPGNISIKWFEDGVLNVAANCIDRHLHKRGDQTAIIWEGDNPSESKHISYRELHDEVCRMANILRTRNVGKGDRVTIYLPMIPEAAYAMLACARIGAIHSVVFAGFSPDSLAQRITDCQSKIIITADEGLRGGKKVPLKANVDAAIAKSGGRRLGRGGQAHRLAGQHGSGARLLVPRSGRDGDERMPDRADERGGSAVHPLHPRARPASPRACCTPRAAISCSRR